MREALPGLPQVLIQPFMDDEIPDRLLAEEPALRRKLELEEPIDREIFEFAAALVKRSRRPEQDNLNLVLHTLNGAAQHARMEGYRGLTEQDVAAAAPSIFHLPDGEQVRHRKSAVDKFLARAPFEVLGQEQAIRTVGARMKSHVLGVRDVDRPLALLLPGPTGVGKTELMMKFALAMNMPFFHVEGAQFSESHTVARLIGSPSGYVGPDKGILYVFAEESQCAPSPTAVDRYCRPRNVRGSWRYEELHDGGDLIGFGPPLKRRSLPLSLVFWMVSKLGMRSPTAERHAGTNCVDSNVVRAHLVSYRLDETDQTTLRCCVHGIVWRAENACNG